MKKIGGILAVVLVAFVLVLAPMGTAKAVEAGPFYVGLFGGYVMPDDLEMDEEGESWDVPLDDSWMIGAKFGYIFPQVKWLAAELEYTYLADMDVDEPEVDGDFNANNLMANLVFRYPEGKIHPYAGFGLGWSFGNIEAQGQDEEVAWVFDEDDNAFAWQLLAGVNFEITPQWSADLGYKYFSCEYEFDNTDADAANHMIFVGVNYHF